MLLNSLPFWSLDAVQKDVIFDLHLPFSEYEEGQGISKIYNT